MFSFQEIVTRLLKCCCDVVQEHDRDKQYLKDGGGDGRGVRRRRSERRDSRKTSARSARAASCDVAGGTSRRPTGRPRYPDCASRRGAAGRPMSDWRPAWCGSRARRSAESAGQPTPRQRDLRRSSRAKPRRCRRTTVSGETSWTAPRHEAHTRDRPTQTSRSRRCRRSRLGACRGTTASWWRSAKTSRVCAVRERTVDRMAAFGRAAPPPARHSCTVRAHARRRVGLRRVRALESPRRLGFRAREG